MGDVGATWKAHCKEEIVFPLIRIIYNELKYLSSSGRTNSFELIYIVRLPCPVGMRVHIGGRLWLWQLLKVLTLPRSKQSQVQLLKCMQILIQTDFSQTSYYFGDGTACSSILPCVDILVECVVRFARQMAKQCHTTCLIYIVSVVKLKRISQNYEKQ